MAIPIIYSLQNQEWWLITLGLILIAAVSDMLDGYFARRAHEVTHIGKWLDPICDSICIASVVFFLILDGTISMWFFIILFFRYVSISIGAIYLINHSDLVLSANIFGKWASGFTALFVLLKIILPHILQDFTGFLEVLTMVSLWIAFPLLLISWIVYIGTFLKEFKKL